MEEEQEESWYRLGPPPSLLPVRVVFFFCPVFLDFFSPYGTALCVVGEDIHAQQKEAQKRRIKDPRCEHAFKSIISILLIPFVLPFLSSSSGCRHTCKGEGA